MAKFTTLGGEGPDFTVRCESCQEVFDIDAADGTNLIGVKRETGIRHGTTYLTEKCPKCGAVGDDNHEPRRCPYCQKIADDSTGLGAKRVPDDGDISVCLYCANIGVFEKGLIVKPTAEVLDEIKKSDSWKTIQDAQAAIRNMQKIS